MIRQIPLHLLFIVVVSGLSCTTTEKTNQDLIIRRTESPAGVDSREPDMNATADGRIVMS